MNYITNKARLLCIGRATRGLFSLSLLFALCIDASAAVAVNSGVVSIPPAPGAPEMGNFKADKGNSPPAALTSYSLMPANGPLRGHLKAADRDNRARELLYSLDPNNPNFAGPIKTAKGGQVWLTDTTTGAFVYRPNQSARGEDSFQYRVDDPESFAVSTRIVSATRRIMPLGDSITQGVFNGVDMPEERIGYRRRLLNGLIANGFNVNFVGSLRNGQNANPPISDPDHEGHPGFTALQIANGSGSYPGVFGALRLHPTDVVLLHIGTNNINFDDTATTTDNIERILNEIDRWERSAQGNPVTVFLAKIIDRSNPQCPNLEDCKNTNVVSLNRKITSIVTRRRGLGDRVVLVNQYSALNYPEDMSRQNNQLIHPNQTGYNKMGQRWLEVIKRSGVLR